MNKSIKNCLLDIIPKEHSWKIILLENWENIIGDLKKTVTIEQINKDILFLGVVHPAWAQEISALAPVLIQKINVFLGKKYIKTIRIKLKQTAKPNKQQCKNKTKSGIEQPALTIKEIEFLNHIKDVGLREIMQNFYLKCKEKQTL